MKKTVGLLRHRRFLWYLKVCWIRLKQIAAGVQSKRFFDTVGATIGRPFANKRYEQTFRRHSAHRYKL